MNSGRSILPNFLLAGAAKSGTTAIYYQLKGHPDIFCCPVKEPYKKNGTGSFFACPVFKNPKNPPKNLRIILLSTGERTFEK